MFENIQIGEKLLNYLIVDIVYDPVTNFSDWVRKVTCLAGIIPEPQLKCHY